MDYGVDKVFSAVPSSAFFLLSPSLVAGDVPPSAPHAAESSALKAAAWCVQALGFCHPNFQLIGGGFQNEGLEKLAAARGHKI